MSATTKAGTAGGTSWPRYVGLQRRSLECADEAELGFLIANETWHLVPYQQAVLFRLDSFQRSKLSAVSGLVSVVESTPFTQWLLAVEKHLASTEPAVQAPEAGAEPPSGARAFTASDLPESLAPSWAEWWPAHALRVPLVTPQGMKVGSVIYTRAEPWQPQDIQLLTLMHTQYAYCLQSLRPARTPLARRLASFAQPSRRWLVAVALAALAAVPVRTSVLAPAEIVALQASAVSSPAEGIVKTFHVPPNREVRAGDRLFSLDDSTLSNRVQVAEQALAVAKTDALSAQQRAIDQAEGRAELAVSLGRVREREAELTLLRDALQRLDVVASQDGIFVYSDPNDWLGRPVATGERIGQLAAPGELGVLVWLPVPDAINLEPGADMKVYLQVQPLNALSAQLEQTSYQAALSPDGVMAYRVRGRLDDEGRAHIGLRGVAKVYGEWQPIAYWLLRRPLGALRQWVGL
ncbi:hypothetical protein J2W49_004649 [Hydrogenophaga palleronii]|uniref:Membrane fusion protein biotin-lipoyl like domain-containing protein n=1 Tax=Hydrogenophaga palleronii TaxID=65655 RepID=A0ABU1WUR1_9BURK|nr:HlyD family efflux transporter periplasmic adaptor subunit [Hydrogenophaga palleronii]MDR7152671.1 hypothetical protein [Hydrogenophaga palleronii]